MHVYVMMMRMNGLSLSWLRPKKKKLFVSCNGPEKNRVGRSVKKIFLHHFLVKNVCFMHVLR